MGSAGIVDIGAVLIFNAVIVVVCAVVDVTVDELILVDIVEVNISDALVDGKIVDVVKDVVVVTVVVEVDVVSEFKMSVQLLLTGKVKSIKLSAAHFAITVCQKQPTAYNNLLQSSILYRSILFYFIP